jgi:hypothetical protein
VLPSDCTERAVFACEIGADNFVGNFHAPISFQGNVGGTNCTPAIAGASGATARLSSSARRLCPLRNDERLQGENWCRNSRPAGRLPALHRHYYGPCPPQTISRAFFIPVVLSASARERLRCRSWCSPWRIARGQTTDTAGPLFGRGLNHDRLQASSSPKCWRERGRKPVQELNPPSRRRLPPEGRTHVPAVLTSRTRPGPPAPAGRGDLPPSSPGADRAAPRPRSCSSCCQPATDPPALSL